MFNLATRQIELAKAAAMDPKLPDWQKKRILNIVEELKDGLEKLGKSVASMDESLIPGDLLNVEGKVKKLGFATTLEPKNELSQRAHLIDHHLKELKKKNSKWSRSTRN